MTGRFVHDAVILDGWPAFAIARVLQRHWRDEVEDLPPHLREPLEEALSALEQAGRAWAQSLRGTAEPAGAEPALDSEVTTLQAAGRLGVSARMVRKLIGQGALPARRTARGWRIEEGGVAALQDKRRKHHAT